MRPTPMTGRSLPATSVEEAHQNQKTTLNENLLQGLALGGCDPLRQPINRLGLPHIIPEALEMIHLASKTFWMNQRKTTKDVV